MGTFTGLPEGASITSRGATFVISYIGGTGNDVVLTVTSVVKEYFLSEGATGEFFSTDILLANPNTDGRAGHRDIPQERRHLRRPVAEPAGAVAPHDPRE